MMKHCRWRIVLVRQQLLKRPHLDAEVLLPEVQRSEFEFFYRLVG
jgi:hypothetical protein